MRQTPWVTCAAALTLGACGSSNVESRPAPSPVVFGGEGAVVGANKELPLPAADSGVERSTGPCANASPASDAALVDDFEDDDAAAFKAFQREGYWFAAADPTEGAMLAPERGAFKPDRLPLAESNRENLFAAHLKASGQKDWGAVWGVTLRWRSEGIRCPLNASAFAGVRFRAKGPGTVRVAFPVPETQPVDAGGTCKARCYDVHGKLVVLTNRWDDYLVRWDHLEQQGWGTEARFEASRINGFQLAVRPQDLPADFWIDDVSFVTEPEAQALSAQLRTQPPPPFAAAVDGGAAAPSRAKTPAAAGSSRKAQ